MSFNLSGLAVYTDELNTELVSRAVLKPQSVQFLTVRPGITAGTQAINILGGTTDITDASCGYGAGAIGSNATTFTQVDLCVLSKQLKEVLCPEDVRDYWLSSQMSPSAYQEVVPFEEQIAMWKVNQVGAYIETALWQGDGVSGSCLVGLLDQISIANGAADASSVAGAWTSTNAVANAWTMIDLLPTAVRQMEGLTMYMSLAQYSKLVQGLLAEGNSILTQYPNITNATGSAVQSFVFPGTNVTVAGLPGIGSSNQVILGPKDYAFMGTGLIDDMDQFRMFYDASNDDVRLNIKFRLGTAALADQFVSNV